MNRGSGLSGFSFNLGLYFFFVLVSLDCLLNLFPRIDFWLYRGFMSTFRLIHCLLLLSWTYHWIYFRFFFSLIFLLVVLFILLLRLLGFLLFGFFELHSRSRIRRHNSLRFRNILGSIDGRWLFVDFIYMID
jgi:hypothetical protein